MNPATIAIILTYEVAAQLAARDGDLVAAWTLAGMVDAMMDAGAEHRRHVTRCAHAAGCAEHYSNGYVAGLLRRSAQAS